MGSCCPKKEQEVAPVNAAPESLHVNRKDEEENKKLKGNQTANNSMVSNTRGKGAANKLDDDEHFVIEDKHGNSGTAHKKRSEVRNDAQATEDYEVVVIGCGVSGIAAADQLQNHGYKVKVLEARDRIGGRINSSQALGYTVDFGASFIHGHEGSPIYELAQKYNVRMIEFDYDDAFAVINGEFRDTEEIRSKFDNFNAMLDDASSQATPEMSLRELADVVAQENGLEGYDKLLFELYLSVDIEGEYAAAPKRMSGQAFGDSKATKGKDFIMPDGYFRIFEQIAKNLDVQLNTPISAITQDDDRVSITCSNGSVIQAKYVVCTLPLGVLKSNTVKFDPPLSEEKSEAIQKLGMGNLDKLIVHFESAFWPDNLCFYLVDQNSNEYMFGANIHKFTGIPALMLFVTESMRQTLKNEDSIREFGLKMLKLNFPDADIKLKKHYLTNWGSELFTRGAYSFFATGSEMEHVEAFSYPEGKIFFAGEHTAQQDMSTVTGAWNTGVAVAQSIAEALKN